MKYVKIILALITTELMFSCGVIESEETVVLVVNNGLDNQVQMRFFRHDLPSGKKVISKLGKGEIFRGEETGSVVLIHEILQSDSIVMIFDNERIETHLLYTNEPDGQSIFSSDSYQTTGNTATYTIDAKNYNNATPCDGPCN